MSPDARLPIPDAPRCAVLTPAGRGAIATVAIRGQGALAVVARRFQSASCRELSTFPAGRTVFGRFQISAATTEELVVGIVAESEVEIHCHGGKAAVEAICDSLVAEGCELFKPELWAAKVEPDPISSQALLALAEARTERTAAILLDQYRGALRGELSVVENALAQDDPSTANATIDKLLARAAVGLHLTQPWKVVLAGRPNAGKSSLMNAILGYQRSIVWHEPGTTRDVLTATTAIEGWPIELIDSAGLRQEGEFLADPIEAAGIARAYEQIATADLVLWIVDAAATRRIGVPPVSQNQRSLQVLNKIDLTNDRHDGLPSSIQTSALTGLGIEMLCQAIAQSLVPDPPKPRDAVPFTSQQVSDLEAIANDLRLGDLSAARERLQGILPSYNESRLNP